MSRLPKEYKIISEHQASRDGLLAANSNLNKNVPNSHYILQRAEEPDRDFHGKIKFTVN
jgi:hypothetical protein